MKTASLILGIANVAVAAGIVYVLSSEAPAMSSIEETTSSKKITLQKTDDSVLSKAPQAMKKKERRTQRNQRISSSFFLPILGERNALTDFVDGHIIDQMASRLPSLNSFKAVLKEAFPDLSEEERAIKHELFRDIVGSYLTGVYNIQRGIDKEGDLISSQAEMKSRLTAELGLDAALLRDLNNKERERKTTQQLKVFEKLLVRDQDKMSPEQKGELTSMLNEQQVTIFDEDQTKDDAIAGSDRALDNVGKILNEDQVQHFQFFQEYHWHSYDMPEMNDIPGVF